MEGGREVGREGGRKEQRKEGGLILAHICKPLVPFHRGRESLASSPIHGSGNV